MATGSCSRPTAPCPALTNDERTLALAGVAGAVGLPGRRHAGGGEVRGARIPPSGAAMSYTLRGRIESRLLSAIAPLVVACVLALTLHRWWPVEIGALMVGVGVTLDVALYHRVFAYQPGWVALPLGAARARARGLAGQACGHRGAARPGSRVLRRHVAARPGARARRLPVAAALVCGGRRRARTPRDRRGRSCALRSCWRRAASPTRPGRRP